MSIKRREYAPEQIDNLRAADMTAVALVEYDSQIFRVEEFFVFKVWVDISAAGSASGVATLSVLLYAADKTTVLDEWDLLTLIDTSTDTEKNLVLFGAGVAAAKKGNATLGALLLSFKVNFQMQLRLTVTTQATGTATAAVRMLAEG
jgi:hypothetical protein